MVSTGNKSLKLIYGILHLHLFTKVIEEYVAFHVSVKLPNNTIQIVRSIVSNGAIQLTHHVLPATYFF